MIDCLEKHCFVRTIAGRNIVTASVHFLVALWFGQFDMVESVKPEN